MSIFFHEGLPRSGKSYAALVDWIIPSLKKGRAVYAYIEGLNHEQIAQVAEISLDVCQRLLIQLNREDVPVIYSKVQNDALVIIDELQNFFPSTREKLKPEMIQFITEHGHRGLDILTMGQVLKDCHAMWRRRTTMKVYFFKREAIGKPNQFVETTFKGIPNSKGDDLDWEETAKRTREYDAKYFGCYKSHEDATQNKDTHVDSRMVIWNNKKLRYAFMAVVLIFGITGPYLYHLFHGGLQDSFEAKIPKKQQSQTTTAKADNHEKSLPAATPAANHQDSPVLPQKIEISKSLVEDDPLGIPDDPLDFVDQLSIKNRIRLAGYMRMGDKSDGYIEWRNDSFGVIDRISISDLAGMGWTVLVNQTQSLAILQKYHRRYLATAWPIPETTTHINQKQIDEQRQPAEPSRIASK